MKLGLRVASPWRLRNDNSYVVAYQCHTDGLHYRVLSPYEAAVVPFLDGEFGEEEIWRIWRDIFESSGLEDCVLRRLFDEQLARLRQDGIVTERGCTSPSLGEDRSSLLPDFTTYKIPGHRLKRPLAVTVTLTNYCRTDCIYCFAERKIDSEFGFDDWVRVFDELKGNEIYIVDISGGDLFARKDAIALLTEMVARDFVFFLSTKCPIDRATAASLAELEIGRPSILPHLKRELQFSVDSSDPVIADRLVGRSNYLRRAIQSIENCVAEGLKPRVKCVLTSLNPDAAEGIVKLFEPLGVHDFQFVQYGRTHYRHNDELFLSGEQKLRLHDQVESIRTRHPSIKITMQDDRTMGEARQADWQNWNARAICSGGRTQMVVKPNGDVTLCDQVPQNEDFIIANIRKSGVIGAWDSKGVDRFLAPPRESFNGNPCFDCVNFDQCHSVEGLGYCFRDSLFAYRNMLEPPPGCPRQASIGLRQI